LAFIILAFSMDDKDIFETSGDGLASLFLRRVFEVKLEQDDMTALVHTFFASGTAIGDRIGLGGGEGVRELEDEHVETIAAKVDHPSLYLHASSRAIKIYAHNSPSGKRSVISASSSIDNSMACTRPWP